LRLVLQMRIMLLSMLRREICESREAINGTFARR
jgi:hypothetical protein